MRQFGYSKSSIIFGQISKVIPISISISKCKRVLHISALFNSTLNPFSFTVSSTSLFTSTKNVL